MSNSPVFVSPNNNGRKTAIGMILGLIAVVIIAGLALHFRAEEPVAVAPPPASKALFADYVVKPGDYLIKIADEQHTTLQALIEANQDVLAENSKDCFELDDNYVAGLREVKKRGKTKLVPRPGYYCNTSKTLDGQPMLGPNSIKAGLHLRIPLEPLAVVDNSIQPL